MPYEEIYLQRLKEENPEEYQKIRKEKKKSSWVVTVWFIEINLKITPGLAGIEYTEVILDAVASSLLI